jgi:glycosyltransferase involved in cell wall biosynthesis
MSDARALIVPRPPPPTAEAGPLRIAHFTVGRCNPESANGIDKTVYHLSRAQAALGHAVAVFSLTRKPALPIPGVTVSGYPPRLPAVTVRGARAVERLLARAAFNVTPRLIDDLLAWRPDVLHLHFVGMPQNVRLAARARGAGIPYCVTIHGGLAPAALARNRWPKRLFAALVERRYLRQAAFLHATSPEDVAGLSAYGVSNATVVAPNGVDVPPAAGHLPNGTGAVAPKAAGRRVFLFLGRLDPEQKGLDLFLRGLACAASPDAAAVLVGPDWRGGREMLERLASALGIADRVAFTGAAFGERKDELITAADVFVHTSRWEGLSFSVLEAAAAGKAMMLTAPADPGGVFARSGAALLVDADPERIGAAISTLLALPPDGLRAMGERARAVVERDFSWPPIARLLVDAYRTHALGARG